VGTHPSAPVGRPSLVLHIGPRKTGTTSIQHALASRREQLSAHGVVYPGTGKQHFPAANRFMGRRQRWDEDLVGDPDEGPWRRLLDEIGDARTGVISSEVLSQARPEQARRLVDSAPDRTPTVVITYRPYEELLSSTWQQLVKEGLREPLPDWSRAAVEDHPERSEAPFPRVLDLATLVDVWGGVVGVENVVIILVDRARPTAIVEAFEQVLDLPRGLLDLGDEGGRKRSLSHQEAELLRRVNAELPRDNDSLKAHRVFRRALARWLDENPPGPDDCSLRLPPDVAELARKRSRQMVDDVAATSDRMTVFGDLESLVPTAPIPLDQPRPPQVVGTSLAADWVATAIRAGLRSEEV
jgi:hypothetical protein